MAKKQAQARIAELSGKGYSSNRIAQTLTKEGFRVKAGKNYSAATVSTFINKPKAKATKALPKKAATFKIKRQAKMPSVTLNVRQIVKLRGVSSKFKFALLKKVK